MAISEPLLPEIRALLEHTWDARVASLYGMSEGLSAGFCGHATHLPDDLCLLEPIGPGGETARPGETSERVYVTNLYNRVLPLIRFEVSDEVTVLDGPCRCGSAFRRIADPLGRVDDTFTYANHVAVHPHVFRSLLGDEHLIEYQVRQTRSGADITAVATSSFDADEVARAIRDSLHHLGLDQPTVAINLVQHLDRQPSGKLRRFIPMT